MTGARVAGLALGLVGVILTARLLGPEGYAVIAYVNVGATLILFAASGWTAAAVTRYGREELERSGTVRTTASARLVVTLPLVAVSGAVLAALKSGGVLPPELTWPLVWLAVALGVLMVAADHFVVLLEAIGRMRASALGLVGRQALMVGGLVAIAISGAARTPLGVVWLTVGVAGLLVAALAIPLGGQRLWPPSLDRIRLRRVLLFSLPMVAFSLSQYGMRSIDIVILRAYRPPADVGIYALAYQSYTMLQQIATTLTIVLVPLFVSLREGGRGELVARYFRRLVPVATLAASVVGGMAGAAAVVALPVVFGTAFEEAARPLAVLAVALVLHGVASLVAPILLLYERAGATGAVNLAAFGVNVAADLVLVGWLDLGVMGPAIATVLALAVIVGGYAAVARRDLGTGPRWNPIVVAPLAAGVLPALAFGGALGAAAGIAAAAAVGVMAAAVHRIIGREDLDLIAQLDLPGPVRQPMLAVLERLAR